MHRVDKAGNGSRARRNRGRAWPIAALLLLCAPAAGAAEPGIAGLWLTGKRKVAVELSACGDALCGRIVWLARPHRRDGSLKRDRENPDPALRDRPICGMTIIEGLQPDGNGGWEGGEFYYPGHGRTYSMRIEPRDGALKVRAFLGLDLFGKSETWVPAPPARRGCPEAG